MGLKEFISKRRDAERKFTLLSKGKKRACVLLINTGQGRKSSLHFLKNWWLLLLGDKEGRRTVLKLS